MSGGDGHAAAAFGLLADQLKSFLNELHPPFVLAIGNGTGSQLPPFAAARALKLVAFAGQYEELIVVLGHLGSDGPSAEWGRLVGILENAGKLLENMPREALAGIAVDPEAIKGEASYLGCWLAGVLTFESGGGRLSFCLGCLGDVAFNIPDLLKFQSGGRLQDVPPGSWAVVDDLAFASAALLNRLSTAEPVSATDRKQHEVDQRKKSQRTRGRKKADYKTRQREAAIADEWERSKGAADVSRAEFARQKEMPPKDLGKLLNRVQKRRKRLE